MTVPENAGRKQAGRFEKGRSGNPAGKPRGSRNRATLAAEALLDGEAEALTQKAVDLALAGDLVALRLCLDRVISPRRERTAPFYFPALRSAADAAPAMAAVLAAVAAGQIGLAEASEVSKLVDAFIRASAVTAAAARAARTEALFPDLF